MLAIVKADAYGHGAVAVARTLEAEGVNRLGVALAEEAIELRVAGIRRPILILGLLPADEIEAAIEYNLSATIDAVATAEELERHAARHNRRLTVHLKIDTGMNRLGVRAEDAAAAAVTIRRMEHLDLEGAYTHFACADCEDDGASGQQLARFTAALAAMRAAGVLPPVIHAANSSALVALPEAHFDMVRAGLALYGITPCAAAAVMQLRPALALRSKVIHLKNVHRGEGASYGHRWRATRDTILGLVPIGYADGYPRALSGEGQVRVGGRLAPVAGTICMDAALVDLTDVPAAAVGMPVTLIEADAASPISAARVAEQCGTIPYEILSGLGKRIPRVYR
jgi:alanine racemase